MNSTNFLHFITFHNTWLTGRFGRVVATVDFNQLHRRVYNYKIGRLNLKGWHEFLAFCYDLTETRCPTEEHPGDLRVYNGKPEGFV